ncbi:hypothetical protein [Umezawaea tangerina]|uniref:Uncharacterized protein n=1 Tax=Umezawaea tangerina TaxID=84725 RepID=A0A2T0TAC1_9PSEU|nr:hypothetical protein [Umezawaea tangerina]PRY42604.1 hypothetical protein CLV43_104439 [Umezawaea tangerina]
MDKTRLGAWLVISLAVAQTLTTLPTAAAPELGATAVIFNAAAAFSAYLLLRRPDRGRWPLVVWSAGFFGWHVTGLATMAGLITTDLDPVFFIASQCELSIAYQAVLATLAGFAVHLLLPRPEKG